MSLIALSLVHNYPGCQFTVEDDYETLIWHDEEIEKPSKEELERICEEYLQYVETQEYKRLRGIEYPPLDTQLDIMYNQGFDAWRKHIYSIKAKYPGPREIIEPTFENPIEPLEKRM